MKIAFTYERWNRYRCCCCLVASVVSDPVQPHRQQPTMLLCPWDSPGKNTGVGCHFLLQCMRVKSEVTQLCLTLHDSMGCSLSGSSVHGIFQARVLEWVAISFSDRYHWSVLYSQLYIWTQAFLSLVNKYSPNSKGYLRLLIFLPAILIPACASSSPAFLMMYSA